jgi:hypothetical protein
MVELDEEHTSTMVNPLLATTLGVKDAKPKIKPLPTAASQKETKPDQPKKKVNPESEPALPMTNFIVLCGFVVVGFLFFIFRDEIMVLLE